MGKTPLSDRNTKYRDVDFGTFRKGLGYSKAEDLKLAPIFVNYMLALDEDVQGKVFLSNEPKLMQFIHVDHVYVPLYPKFSARKMNTTEEQITEWVKGWVAVANKYNVPVTFVKIGLDNYLR